MIWYWYSKVST